MITDDQNHNGTVVFKTPQGDEVRGALLRLTRHVVAFEMYHTDSVLRTSQALQEFKIHTRGRIAYAGRAVIRDLVNTGTVVVCDADLDDLGFDTEFYSFVSHTDGLRDQFDDFVREWQKLCLVRPEFKVALADIQSFLIDLRRWVEQIELGVRGSPRADRLQLENEVIEKLSARVIPAIDNLFGDFERIAATLDAASRPVYRSYAQRLLHPIVLCAPFAYRTYTKPLGYAGDYEMVNMMLRDPKEVASLFAKIFNVWLLHQDTARAHRNRIQFLHERLVQEAMRCARQNQPLRVFSLGCGPASEVQRFLVEGQVVENAQFTLLDFNDETVQHTSLRLDELKKHHGRQVSIQVQKRSVHQVLRDGNRSATGFSDRGYDLVYCSGLFDYLADRTCKQLMNILWNRTKLGGVLLTTNVTPLSPNRGSLELVLDWHLIYRDAARLAALAPNGTPMDGFRIYNDDTGVNIFFEARKPDA